MRTILWLGVGLVLAACAAPAGPATAPPTAVSVTAPGAAATAAPTDRMVVVPDDVPPVNTSSHAVPLDQIYFDTFRPVNRAVPLSEADAKLIEQLRDAIPPIHEPRYEPVTEADWLADDDVVLGYAVDGDAWAYPVRILNFHEIVNDFLGGAPVLISYCPLCYSGIVYSREVGGQVLTFGNTSALYESDMVMLDYATGSYWWQVAGRAIVGPLTGSALTVLPSATTTWGNWRELYPDTLVLSRETGFGRNYDRDPFAGLDGFINEGNFAFPVSAAGLDARLSPGDRVLAVQVAEAVRAYPVAAIGDGALADTLGGEDIVVFVRDGAGAAFRAGAGGQALTFTAAAGRFTDDQTGSEWDFAGRALAGPLAGSQLEPVAAKTSFWFAVVAAEPNITIYGE